MQEPKHFEEHDPFPYNDHQRAEVRRVIDAGTDPNEVLRDWMAHVTTRGIHPGQQRMTVVDINFTSIFAKKP